MTPGAVAEVAEEGAVAGIVEMLRSGGEGFRCTESVTVVAWVDWVCPDEDVVVFLWELLLTLRDCCLTGSACASVLMGAVGEVVAACGCWSAFL